MIKQLVFVPAFLVSISAFAFTNPDIPSELTDTILSDKILTDTIPTNTILTDTIATDFYTINDTEGLATSTSTSTSTSTLTSNKTNPLRTLDFVAKDLSTQAARFVSLVKWDHHSNSLEQPNEPYNRLRHFGGWLIEDYKQGGCIDTRAKVLIRQSGRRVTMSENGCRVVSGSWQDPYSGHIMTEARELDIDHVVPLKNSYKSGAWKWDRTKRCAYANFMANDFHLIAVNSSDNREKGDNGPDQFMPESESFACEYLNDWLKIKLIWGLVLPSEEASAVSQLLRSNRCNVANLSMSVDDLRNQRRQIANQSAICAAAL